MTHRLDEMNPLDAAYKVARAYPGGIEALALRLNCAAKSLYNKLERTTESHHLRFGDFEEIIARCVDAKVADAYAPLRALNYRFGHVAIKLPDFAGATGKDLERIVCRCFSEGGDVARIVDEAISNDGAITHAELRAIEPEIQQAMEALAELRERVRRAASKPKALNAVA